MEAALTENRDDLAQVAEVSRSREKILAEIKKVIVGQDAIIEQLLIALLCRGHCLLEGVPGLAKTLLISTLAEILELRFNRIQFTPDLMPSDITGTEILEEDVSSGRRSFKFIKGPIFCNILLADEINRTPPKTQAALLQAMQEYKVTAGGATYLMDPPFFVLATQNPIEHEGTYPLPEAQLDRFMFNLFIDYPPIEDEVEIVTTTTSAYHPRLQKVMHSTHLLEIQELVRRVPVASHVVRYAVRLVQASRPKNPQAPDFVREWVNWGAGPRASQYLVLGAKSRALIQGRPTVTVEDVRALAPAVLRHRILTNFAASAAGINSLTVVHRLLEEVGIEE
ncbi:MAG: AAA family ATPase [Candidatus Tectomicrobia bacterium]|uniref:AAA family ATPase n=1 Tax=Tectimicrobiota bacterium TaxID=2528274 RepID=A0A932GNY1_UNCTE|nr:AAA family ATPase [Candidatus Tectomicrobia bacterium]